MQKKLQLNLVVTKLYKNTKKLFKNLNFNGH